MKMYKNIVIAASLLLAFSISLPAGSAEAADKKKDAAEKIDRAIEGLKKSLKSMEDINAAAAKNLRGNAIKAMAKGAYDTYEWLSMPSKELLDFGVDALNKFLFEKDSWGYATKKEAKKSALGADAAERFTELSEMYSVMQKILETKDLSRYDSDKNPFKYTSSWWSPPDGREDEWLQTITRRTYIIREFSKKIIQVTKREIAKLEAEKKRLSEAKDEPEKADAPAPGGVYEKTYTKAGCILKIRFTGVSNPAEFVRENNDAYFTVSSVAVVPGKNFDMAISLVVPHLKDSSKTARVTYSKMYPGSKSSEYGKHFDKTIYSSDLSPITWDKSIHVEMDGAINYTLECNLSDERGSVSAIFQICEPEQEKSMKETWLR